MPKLKSHSGTKDRVRVTKNGRVRVRHSHASHFHNFSKILRFAEGCGAEVPRWVRIRMEKYYDDAASIRAFGLDVVTGLCERLLAGGAPGLHFYTLNQAGLTTEIWRRLNLE